jgi:uncharacterized integral membrane protein
MSNGNRKQSAVRVDAILFDLIILCFFLLLALISFAYNPRARSIPLGLGILGSVMTVMQLMVDSLPGLRSKLRFVSATGLLAKEGQARLKGPEKPESEGIPTADPTSPVRVGNGINIGREWWRVLRVVLWLAGFIVLLAATHYLIAVGAFIVLVTRFEAKESWKRAILLGACTNLGFFILFDLLLKVQL